jgi:hypothetical protein
MKTFCYHCGNVFDVLDTDQDKEIQCPNCRKAFCADACDECGSTAPPGVVSDGKKLPRWDLSMIERVCRILATLNGALFCFSVLGAVICVLAVLVENFLLAVAVLIGSCVQLAVMFSIAWALIAISEIISQANISNPRVHG